MLWLHRQVGVFVVFSSQRQRQQRVKDFAYHGEFVGRAVAWMAGLFPPYQAPKNFPEKRFPPPGRHGFRRSASNIKKFQEITVQSWKATQAQNRQLGDRSKAKVKEATTTQCVQSQTISKHNFSLIVFRNIVRSKERELEKVQRPQK